MLSVAHYAVVDSAHVFSSMPIDLRLQLFSISLVGVLIVAG